MALGKPVLPSCFGTAKDSYPKHTFLRQKSRALLNRPENNKSLHYVLDAVFAMPLAKVPSLAELLLPVRSRVGRLQKSNSFNLIRFFFAFFLPYFFFKKHRRYMVWALYVEKYSMQNSATLLKTEPACGQHQK